MFFKFNSKPGKGIEKRDPNMPRHKVFFEIFPDNLWRIIKVNALYIVTAVPLLILTMIVMKFLSVQILDYINLSVTADVIVDFSTYITIVLSYMFMVLFGQGPITAGYTFVMREFANERPCWLVGDFFHNIKSNFLQGISLWFIDLCIVFGGFTAIVFYLNKNMYIFVVVLLLAINVYIIAHQLIYQMMITYKLKLKHILKNSILLALGKLPQTLVVIFSVIFVQIIIPFVVLKITSGILTFFSILVIVFIIPAISSFAINFYIYPIIKNSMEKVENNN